MSQLDYPKTFFIELTSYCNLKCTMCNYHAESVTCRRDKGFMDKNLALGLLDQIGNDAKEKAWVALHGAGEALMHKEWYQIVKHGAEYQNLEIGFLTNGMFFSDENIDKIIDSRLKWVSVSIDGIDKRLFEKYRKGSNYEKVVNGTVKLIDNIQKSGAGINVSVNMTLQEEMEKDVTDYVKFWLSHVENVYVSPCRQIGSRISPYHNDFANIKRVPCYMLNEMMVIYWDGSVGLCCEDWFNDGRVGNVSTDSILDVWNCDKYNYYRRCHEKGCYSEIELCRECTSWANQSPLLIDSGIIGVGASKSAWQIHYYNK